MRVLTPAYQCVEPGCTRGTCTTGYGRCYCYEDRKYYNYESNGLSRGAGDCHENNCGERRFHASETLGQAPPITHARSASDLVGEGDSAVWGPILPEERMFVLSRCSHTYVMFIPTASQKQPEGGI
jgi:hypothetical protein